MGYCYENGIGTEKNEKKAYLKSSKKGNAVAQNNLGHCYEKGIGTNKNQMEAFRWYLKSAINGNSEARNNLSGFHYYGIGSSRNKKHFNANQQAKNTLLVNIIYKNSIGMHSWPIS